eukprot:TRINITY_DN56066_c0_g3_i1.p1 TRINITY_DN56066_c0_g3~~TRINITY_DN56066_c0_g3_i1.p1  ORF type:complete len:519 (-),score=28.23 TRINITY_DN56066_c0_g3_i1:589-2145(-)
MPRRHIPQAFDTPAPRPTTAKLLCNFCGHDFGRNATTQAALLKGAQELAQHILVCQHQPPSNDSIDQFQNNRQTRDEVGKLEALQAFHEEQARKLQARVDNARSTQAPYATTDTRPSSNYRGQTHTSTSPSHGPPQPHVPTNVANRVRARQTTGGQQNVSFTGEERSHVPDGTNVQSFDLFSGNQSGWAAQSVRVRCQYCGKGQAEHKLRQHEAICPFKSPVDGNLPKGAHLPPNCGEVGDNMTMTVRAKEARTGVRSMYGSQFTHENNDANHANFTNSTRERRTEDRRNPGVGRNYGNGPSRNPYGTHTYGGHGASYGGSSSPTNAPLTQSVPEHVIRQMYIDNQSSPEEAYPPQPRRVQSLRTATATAHDMYSSGGYGDDGYGDYDDDEEEETYDIGTQTSIRVPKGKGGGGGGSRGPPQPGGRAPTSIMKKGQPGGPKYGPPPTGGDLNGRSKARQEHLNDKRPYWEKLAPKMNMVECDICGRTFSDDRIGKHQAICEKNVKRRIVASHSSVPGR